MAGNHIDFIVAKFATEGWTWVIDGEARKVTYKMVEQTLDRMSQLLDNVEKVNEVEVGRLLMKREDDDYSVYLYLGDYYGKSN